MELAKSMIHMSKEKGNFVNQVTFDRDFNIPDAKPDVARLILDKGRIWLDASRIMEEKVELGGKLAFEILYATDGQMNEMEEFAGEIPFSEIINTPQVSSQDFVQPDWEMEDMTVSLINSRKIRVSAVVTFRIEAEQLYDEEAASGLADGGGMPEVDSMEKSLEVMQLRVQKRDTIRVREEIELGGNKPNILQLLWKELSLGGMEYKLSDGKITLRGELTLFAVYQGEEEHIPLQWLEKSISFTGEVECGECTFSMIPDIRIKVAQEEIDVKPDYDGENRVISVDLMLEMFIQLYEEDTVTLLSDAYSPREELILEQREVAFPQLLMKNNGKCKVNEKLKLADDANMLQICHSQGQIQMDRAFLSEDGLVLEGAINVVILYMSSEDTEPIRCYKGAVPFSHLLEVKGIHEGCSWRVRPQMEQMTTVMLGNDEVEVRAILGFDTLVYDKHMENVITDITERPFDEEVLEKMPGIVGYIVSPGDTLWSIAKRFYTSVESIKSNNNLTGDTIKPGDRLLIIKEAGQL